MKVIIAGTRTIMAFHDVRDIIDRHYHNGLNITEVVCGMANGVDTFGHWWAESYNIPIKEFPADWNKHGKAAGPIRNKQMAEYADAALVIWDGKSKGSKNMIEEMKKRQKPVYVIEF